MPTTLAEQRAARARTLAMLFAAGVAGLALAVRWIVRKTWRRLLPCYWTAAALGLAWLSGPMGIPTGTVALGVSAALVTAAAWPAASRIVRIWRAGIVAVLGAFTVATTAAGGPAAMDAHPVLTVFWPVTAGVLLGWPWWHHLRQPVTLIAQPVPEAPQPSADEALTAQWARRWEREVLAQGVCEGTRLVHASSPRDGVTEAILQLSAGKGMKPSALMKKGPEVEVALQLDEGAIGWQSTGKAALVRVSLVEKSYVAGGVPWTGPTYRDGRCRILTYVDGSPGAWVFSRPGFGVLGGLLVGSTGSGKSRALGVLIANLLDGGWMVAVGDSQYGQSLPAWKTKTDYHAGPEAVILLLRRFHAEVMHRSQLLADAGIEVFDEADPRVQALGIKKLSVIVDECQMVLIRNHPIVLLVQESVETQRKTGAALTLATQLPQMGSLGGSIRIRDAAVAGNTLILRVSNRGSGSSILPDDFIGDPFAIEPEDDQGRTTAGMGYLRANAKVGMIGRVPRLDEIAAAAAAPDVPVVWLVDPIKPGTPFNKPRTGTPVDSASAGSSVGKLRSLFGVGPRTAQQQAVEPMTSTEWVLACLRRGPASAQALLDRPDCPVSQAQLYALLTQLKDAGRIIPPATRGMPYTIADRSLAPR